MAECKKILFKENSESMDKILYKNKLHIGSKNTTEVINDLFIEKIEKLHKNLEAPIDNAMNQYTKFIQKPDKLFSFKEINMHQLKQIFKSVKKSNSNSHDQISSKMIAIIEKSILPLILKLINASI